MLFKRRAFETIAHENNICTNIGIVFDFFSLSDLLFFIFLLNITTIIIDQ